MRNERHGFSIICQTKITELGDLSNTNKKNLVASKCWILTRKIWTNTGQYPLLSPPVYESGGMRCAGHLVEFQSKIKQSLDRFKSSLTWLLFTPLVIEHGPKKNKFLEIFPWIFPYLSHLETDDFPGGWSIPKWQKPPIFRHSNSTHQMMKTIAANSTMQNIPCIYIYIYMY